MITMMTCYKRSLTGNGIKNPAKSYEARGRHLGRRFRTGTVSGTGTAWERHGDGESNRTSNY